VLAIDEEVADRWGRLVAERYSVGRPVGVMDAFVAATAHCHGLSVVTRNVTDFVPFEIPIVNPWTT
jgi:predicted nucleic acid-binding protein